MGRKLIAEGPCEGGTGEREGISKVVGQGEANLRRERVRRFVERKEKEPLPKGGAATKSSPKKEEGKDRRGSYA